MRASLINYTINHFTKTEKYEIYIFNNYRNVPGNNELLFASRIAKKSKPCYTKK